MNNGPINVLTAFDGSVWAIMPDKLGTIVQAVEGFASRTGAADADHLAALSARAEERKSQPLYERMGITVTEKGTAVVPLHGTVMKRADLFMNISGGVSTEMLTKAVKALAADDAVRAVVFDVDSPGGSVEGLSEAAAAIRALSGVKPTASVANDMMASAAYWLASAADRVYTTRDALVGSIGVYMVRRDFSRAAANEGIKFHVISAGEFKGLGEPTEPMTEKERSDLQRIVDAYYREFVSNVSANLNISTADAEALADGRVHVGTDAVTIGMANAVKTLDEIVAGFDAEATAEDNLAALKAHYADLQTAHAALKAEYEAFKGQAATEIEALKAAEKERLEAAAKEKATAAIRTLQEDGKIAAALKAGDKAYDDLHAALVADYDKTLGLYAAVPKGAAAPQTVALAEEPAKDDGLPKTAAAAAALGYKVAQGEDDARIYAEWGLAYFRADTLEAFPGAGLKAPEKPSTDEPKKEQE